MVVVSLLGGVAVPAATAANPTVVGKITGGVPPSSRALTEVRAFEAGRGLLMAKATVSRTGTFRLALPPGGYVLATSITPEHGRSRAAVGRIVPLTLATGQRRRSVRIAKPTVSSSAAGVPSAHAAYTQESGAITPGSIAFSIEKFAGATGDLGVMNRGLADMLQTDLVRLPCRSAEVANSTDRKLIEGELDFQKSSYVDPATRVTRNFILSDIVVRGRLHSRGDDLDYVLTLVDARTGATLETLSGTLIGSRLFEDEPSLAARLAKRLCAYGEVFEVEITGTGTADYATHSAAGTLSAEKITAKPTARDAQGPTTWEGSAPLSWSDVTAASKMTDCTTRNPVSGGTWTAKLGLAGDGLEVEWIPDQGAIGTISMVCPTGDGGENVFAGFPTTSPLGAEPQKFVLPTDGVQPITGGLKDLGYGWDNTLELSVRTVRVEPLG